MIRFLRQCFTWWHGQTLGVRVFTWRRGRLVGRDVRGNLYYEDRRDRQRRWMVFGGEVEASRAPPEWRMWLHGLNAEPPDPDAQPLRSWWKPHRGNMTGSAQAYHPSGSLVRDGQRAPAGGDYEPWRPGGAAS